MFRILIKMMPSNTSSSNLSNVFANGGCGDGKSLTQKTWGVSVPLSTEYPSLKDKELTERLESDLRRTSNVFESDSELRHRMDVLHKINTLFKNWIKEISISKVNKSVDFLTSFYELGINN